MKRYLLSLALLCLVATGAHAYWQSRAQVAIATGGGGFQGPGDVVSGAVAWRSCARVYQASLASTATSLCDLVDSAAPTVTICTLRGTTSGFVDLTAYCPGSVTPAAKCAAATGGTCSIQKMYDQTGNSNHSTNVTAASQPRLLFSALNGLPGITCLNANGTFLATPSLTLANLTMVGVFERTGNFAAANIFEGAQGTATWIGISNLSNQSAMVNGGSAVQQAATDSVFHSVIGVMSSVAGASAMNTDGTELTSQSPGTTGFSATPARLCRSNTASSASGTLMEAGIWPSLFTTGGGGQTSLMNTNMHDASNGYNF